ncbi:MAG: hypothetical protein PHD13_03975 [Methanocellales archaeon]|nr:hypothetical protein [Methanocellales archaeon]MDD3291213.1 hypothetical protein [Methanocellales archaeon]MDD5235313.1 hypothetical protein [Methanocellales archaeon]MDD5484531.1 hypothetical protein [Methanocellales archaeon]
MKSNNLERNKLILGDADIIFMYSFDFGHPIDAKKIVNSLADFGILLDQFKDNGSKKYADKCSKFVRNISYLDKMYISEEDVHLNKYSRIIFKERSYTNDSLDTDLIIFSTLYDIGVGTLTVCVPLKGNHCIEEVINVVKLGLPAFPYSIVKKIPITAYKNSKYRDDKRIDYIGYQYIQKILEKGKKVGIKDKEEELVYDKIDCYPYITIRSFKEELSIDEFGKKYINELWGILSGDSAFEDLRKETIATYLDNIAIYNDRLAMPSEDGTIYVFGNEAKEVYNKTITTLNPNIKNFQDFIEYRVLAYYLFTEFYRFEVFYLKVLSWKLSLFLDIKLPTSSMNEIIKYYYLFSKNLEHYYNFGEYLLLYLPTWNRQVWKGLREKEVSDSYNNLLEGLKIIETTVQLSNNRKNQAYAIIISFLLVLLSLISVSNLTYGIKVVVTIVAAILTSLIVWVFINWYFKNQLKKLIIKK